MENTHSILCSQINSSDTADELRKKAKSIFQSKDKQLHYRSYLTTPKQFSFSHNQLSLLKVRCAQALSSMFIKISRSPGQSLFSLKQQLQHKCSNSCHTANNVPQQKYEDDCFIFRVSLCYQAGSNKKNVIYLCVTFPARMRIGPSCLVVFTHSMMFASVNQLHVHCVRSFYKKKVKELGKTAEKAILNSASNMLKLNPKLITDNYVY